MKFKVLLFSLLVPSFAFSEHNPPKDVNLTDLDHMMACMQSGDGQEVNGGVRDYSNAMVSSPVDNTTGRFYNNIDYANANRTGANSTDYYYDTYVNQVNEGQYRGLRQNTIYVMQRGDNGVSIQMYDLPRGASPSGDRHYQFSRTMDRVCAAEYNAEMNASRELPRPSGTFMNGCDDNETPLTIRAQADRDNHLTFAGPGDLRGNPTVLNARSWPHSSVSPFYSMLSEEILQGLERVSADLQGTATINYQNAETNPCAGNSACNDAFNCLQRLHQNGLLNMELMLGAQSLFPGFPGPAGSALPVPATPTGGDPDET
jgi:hypothetical protein